MPTILISLLMNRYVRTLLMVAGVALAAYLYGHHVAAQACHDAELRAVIETQKRDLKARDQAAELQNKLQAELTTKYRELEDMVNDYDKEILLRPTPACTLDERDAGRLRDIGKR